MWEHIRIKFLNAAFLIEYDLACSANALPELLGMRDDTRVCISSYEETTTFVWIEILHPFIMYHLSSTLHI